MGWVDAPLQDPRLPGTKFYGATRVFGPKVGCGCVKCCGKWYIGDVPIDIKFEIRIDVAQHTRDGFGNDYVNGNTTSVEGTYGHEQRHVRRGVSLAEAYAANTGIDFNRNFGEGGYGEFTCKKECQAIVRRITTNLGDIMNEAMDHDSRLPEGSPQPPWGEMPEPNNK